MRCLSCNVILSDKEATRKYASTGEFVDLCDHCFSTVDDQILVVDGTGDDEPDMYDFSGEEFPEED